MHAKLVEPGTKDVVPQAWHCIIGGTPQAGYSCTPAGSYPWWGNCFAGVVPYV